MRDFPEGEFAPGEGLQGAFDNTSELHVMKYKAAMATKDCPSWELAVEEEHKRMFDSGAWKATLYL
jgi:hypothetical protein